MWRLLSSVFHKNYVYLSVTLKNKKKKKKKHGCHKFRLRQRKWNGNGFVDSEKPSYFPPSLMRQWIASPWQFYFSASALVLIWCRPFLSKAFARHNNDGRFQSPQLIDLRNYARSATCGHPGMTPKSQFRASDRLGLSHRHPRDSALPLSEKLF